MLKTLAKASLFFVAPVLFVGVFRCMWWICGHPTLSGETSSGLIFAATFLGEALASAVAIFTTEGM